LIAGFVIPSEGRDLCFPNRYGEILRSLRALGMTTAVTRAPTGETAQK